MALRPEEHPDPPPALVLDAVASYAAGVDAQAPGVLTGLYLVGSAALGDWLASSSNIDLVAVAEKGWESVPRGVLRRAQAPLKRPGRPARVAYVSAEALDEGPGSAAIACYQGSRLLQPADELANPLTWTIVAEDGIVARGPEYPGVWRSAPALRSWAQARLRSRAARLARRARRPGALWLRRSVVAEVLEACRLSEVAAGGLVGKTAGAEAVRHQAGEGSRERIVQDVLNYRAGGRTSLYWGFFERKHHAVDLVRYLAAQAPAEAEGGTA